MGGYYMVPVAHLSDTQIYNIAQDTGNELALELIRRRDEDDGELEELRELNEGADKREEDAKDEGEKKQWDADRAEVTSAADRLERDIVDMIDELHTAIDELDAEGKASAKLYISKVMTRLGENVVSTIRDAIEVNKP